MTTADDIVKAAKELEEAQKANQTALAVLQKYQNLSELVQQMHALCSTQQSKTDDKPVEKTTISNIDTYNRVTAGKDPIINYPDSFSVMHGKFKEACQRVCNGADNWSRIQNLSDFNDLNYNVSNFRAVDLFNMIWLATAALMQRLSNNRTWYPTPEMQPLIDAINMLNTLKFSKQ